MTTISLDISKELKSKNYYVENVNGWDSKFIHFYLTYLRIFSIKLEEQRFNPEKYSIKIAKRELSNIIIAISTFEYLIKKFSEIKDISDDVYNIYQTLKKILYELNNNKKYLENLSDPEKNESIKNSFRKLQLSNFLSD